jgi:hypothetical protein
VLCDHSPRALSAAPPADGIARAAADAVPASAFVLCRLEPDSSASFDNVEILTIDDGATGEVEVHFDSSRGSAQVTPGCRPAARCKEDQDTRHNSEATEHA